MILKVLAEGAGLGAQTLDWSILAPVKPGKLVLDFYQDEEYNRSSLFNLKECTVYSSVQCTISV